MPSRFCLLKEKKWFRRSVQIFAIFFGAVIGLIVAYITLALFVGYGTMEATIHYRLENLQIPNSPAHSLAEKAINLSVSKAMLDYWPLFVLPCIYITSLFAQVILRKKSKVETD